MLKLHPRTKRWPVPDALLADDPQRQKGFGRLQRTAPATRFLLVFGNDSRGRGRGWVQSMAKKRDDMADGIMADDREGWLANLLADEEPYDRRKLWQLGSWAAATLGALSFAFLAAQSSNAMRSDLVAANGLVLKNLQLAEAATERETEARRLTSAIDILNADRDRLYARVSGLEQGLDSVTGSIKRSAPLGPLPFASSAPPIIGVPETVLSQPAHAQPLSTPPARAAVDDKPALTVKDTATAQSQATSSATAPEATKPQEPPQATPATSGNVAASAPAPAPSAIVTAALPAAEPNPDEAVTEVPATRIEFGVDLGTASSMEGLRALWRGVQSSNKTLLAPLRPIVALKERSGLGMQLRLVAGPLSDAAAAARVCAVLTENERPCETAFFDGQRLAAGPEIRPDVPAAKPAPPRRKRSSVRASRNSAAVTPRPQRTGFSSFLGSN